MNTAIVNIKVEPKIKKEAKKVASDLGFSLSGLITACLKQIIRNKAVYFTMNEDNPSPFLLGAIKAAAKEKKSNRHRIFPRTKDAIAFLDK